ncbi:unnamed protein product [Victoria cruziana]
MPLFAAVFSHFLHLLPYLSLILVEFAEWRSYWTKLGVHPHHPWVFRVGILLDPSIPRCGARSDQQPTTIATQLHAKAS